MNFASIIRTVTYFLILFSCWSCSQQIPPTGGKKDIIAPELIKSIPSNKQTNYEGKIVELKFNEYIVVEGLQQKLLITPDAGEYESKTLPEGLRITFKKPLEKNRTYSLSFGDAVKDFSERNPVKNLRLVFSTGIGLDSASIRGNVRTLKTNQPTFETLVGLYRNSDTLNPEKIKPTYFTRTDSSGNFIIENIQPNAYRLIAIEDQNRSLTYNMRTERIGFLRDSILVRDSTQISGVSIATFLANRSPQKVKTTQPRVFYYNIVYDKGFVNYEVKFNKPEDSLTHFQSAPNEIRFFNTKNRKDTTVAKITLRDSLGLVFEHTQKIKFRDVRANNKNPEQNQDALETRAKPEENKEISPGKFDFTLTFNKPIIEARLDQIKMRSDSTKNEILQPSNFKWTNSRTQLQIQCPIKATKELKLVIPKNTFLTIENDTVPAKTYKFAVMEEENYGIIEGEVKSTTESFVVELLNDKYEVVEAIANQKNFRFSYIKPDIYWLRVIIDENKNNQWDTGDFKANQLAEPVIFLPSPIKVKKNFVLTGYILDLSTK
jgi:Bacterial Ig-like domain